MDTDDVVLALLKKLREGVGLTADRLGASGNVMSALGLSDPQLAVQRLLRLLDELGDTDRARVLRVDLGLDLERLLGRRPHPRERDLLGERRSGYAEVVRRDVKTLARWSDKALSELRSKLLADQFTGHLFVVAAVTGDRILGMTTIQRDVLGEGIGPQTHPSTEYPNPSSEPSLPCLIYGYPRDWKPATLTLVVVFTNQLYPRSIWAVVAPNFFELVYAAERHPVQLHGDTATCRFERPRTDRLYAIWWRAKSG